MTLFAVLACLLLESKLSGFGQGVAASSTHLRTKVTFLNGLFDSVPVGAQDAMKAIIGSEHYAVVRMAGDALSEWEKSDIENIGSENEQEARKSAEETVRNCERHPHATKSPCWNTCRDPVVKVERHLSQSIDPNQDAGPNRIERVFAVICPWHIRDSKNREPFSKNNVNMVRNRGQLGSSKATDDAAHLVASVLGGLSDIDRNAFPQTTIADQPAHIRRSETHIQDYLLHRCRCPGGGDRMVLYDIVLHYVYEDATDTSTRPTLLHYVGSFYEWQRGKTFRLLEVSTEVQDNAPHFNYAGVKQEL